MRRILDFLFVDHKIHPLLLFAVFLVVGSLNPFLVKMICASIAMIGLIAAIVIVTEKNVNKHRNSFRRH